MSIPIPRNTSDRGAGWRVRFLRFAPILLLLLSLALAGLGAMRAYQAQQSHRATADALLRDYGAFVAWSYADQWTGRLNESLAGTLHGVQSAMARGVDVEDCLEMLLAANDQGPPECACGTRLTGPASWTFHASFSGGPPSTITAGAAPGEHRLDRLVETVIDHARTVYRAGQMHAVLTGHGHPSEPARILAYARAAGPVGDTVVYGIELDPRQLEDFFERILDDSELLPPSLARGEPNRSLVAVTLNSAGGDLRFQSDPGVDLSHPAEQQLSEQLGGGAVIASVHPEAADQLIIGGLPRDRTSVLLGIFLLAGGLALLAVIQLRNENQLARMRSDFVASVSHELRSPLAQVRLFIETLRLGRTRTDAQAEWALANIDRETLRLVGLVENVLTFSRADRGRLSEAELRTKEFGKEISAATASFSALLPSGRVHLKVRSDAGLRARLHEDSFRQVVLNLLDNAVRYGPKRQTIQVVAEGIGDRIRFAVEDQGAGVRAEEREAIFEPFRRGRDAVDAGTTGSGIGLAVVREIVHAHGGRTWVEDAEGGGARFVVELPRLDPVAPLPAKQPLGRVASAGAA